MFFWTSDVQNWSSLSNRCLPRKVGTSMGMENMISFPPKPLPLSHQQCRETGVLVSLSLEIFFCLLRERSLFSAMLWVSPTGKQSSQNCFGVHLSTGCSPWKEGCSSLEARALYLWKQGPSLSLHQVCHQTTAFPSINLLQGSTFPMGFKWISASPIDFMDYKGQFFSP